MGILYSNICMQYIGISIYLGSVSVLVLVYSVRYIGMDVWIYSYIDILIY